MQRKKRLFITIGILINLLLVAGIYVNYRLDKMVAHLNQPGVFMQEVPVNQEDSPAADSGDKPAGSTVRDDRRSTAPALPSPQKKSSQLNGQDIATGVQSKVNRPIEKKDLISAGLIVVRRLEWQEIDYLYRVGIKDKQSPEEIRQVRHILQSRLSPEEIKELQKMGRKYGRGLTFLDH